MYWIELWAKIQVYGQLVGCGCTALFIVAMAVIAVLNEKGKI